jgi:hypothetical protein
MTAFDVQARLLSIQQGLQQELATLNEVRQPAYTYIAQFLPVLECECCWLSWRVAWRATPSDG